MRRENQLSACEKKLQQEAVLSEPHASHQCCVLQAIGRLAQVYLARIWVPQLDWPWSLNAGNLGPQGKRDKAVQADHRPKQAEEKKKYLNLFRIPLACCQDPIIER